MFKPSQWTTALALTATAALTAPHTHAAIIAEENFDYGSTNVELRNLDGGTGWSGNWNNIDTTTEYDASLNITPNVTGYSNTGNVGGSATLGPSGSNIHVREFNAGGAQTVWFSAAVYLNPVDPNAATLTSTDRVLLWIDSTSATTNSGDIVGVSGGDGFFRYNAGTTQTGPAAPVDEAFLILAKAEIDFTGGTNDRLSFWLAPSDVSSEAALGSATYVGSNGNTFGPSIDGIAIQFFGNGVTPGSIDAIRIGTELSDVTGFVIPEPASLALLGLGTVLIAGRRRRD